MRLFAANYMTFEIFELRNQDRSCSIQQILHYDTGTTAPMNSAVIADDKNYIVVAGMDDHSQLYMLRHKIITPKKAGEVVDGLRKRRGNLTRSEDYNAASKVVTFDMSPMSKVRTDFHQSEGFQKNVCFVHNMDRLITAGADGHVRAWQYPTLDAVYDIEAHTNEVDDIDVNPAGDLIVTASRDGFAYVWATADGTKKHDLTWTQKVPSKYRCRSCRFGTVADQDADAYCLYTTHIPVQRTSRRPLPCYITKWNKATFSEARTVSIGTEIPSAFTASDNGIYLGVGTLVGTVYVYIAFSLQQVYCMKEVHSIFVTGLTFTPSSTSCRAITGDHDFSLFSISVDNQVKLHQLESRAMISPLWAVVGLVLVVYLIFWVMSTYGF